MVKQKKEPDIMESRHRRAKHGGSRSKNKKKHRVLKIIGFIVLFFVLISGVMLGKAYMDITQTGAVSTKIGLCKSEKNAVRREKTATPRYPD